MGSSLRKQSTGLLTGLAIQYALGMYANLFVTFPDGAQGGAAWEFVWSQPALAAHIILGIFLLTGAIAFLVRILRRRDPIWKAPALLGLAGILGAGASGANFVATQSDMLSYAMSLFFVLAITAYFWGFIRESSGAK